MELPLPQIFGPCLLWPNGWMHQDSTWYGGRPQPRGLCVRWGPNSHSPERGRAPPQFLAHVCCGQTAGWIKMALGMEVSLGPGHTVLDGESAPLPKKGADPPNFQPIFIVANWLDASRCTSFGGRPQPRRLCVRWGPSPLSKRGGAPNFSPTSIVTKWLHGSRCHLVRR